MKIRMYSIVSTALFSLGTGLTCYGVYTCCNSNWSYGNGTAGDCEGTSTIVCEEAPSVGGVPPGFVLENSRKANCYTYSSGVAGFTRQDCSQTPPPGMVRIGPPTDGWCCYTNASSPTATTPLTWNAQFCGKLSCN